ncbi:MAG: hypothetical protein ACYS8W_06400 [Planctomycetota bacterium]|jgi:hypothetical protein
MRKIHIVFSGIQFSFGIDYSLNVKLAQEISRSGISGLFIGDIGILMAAERGE